MNTQMLIHPISEEELMAYLDGELPVERASVAAAHLKQCRDCQALAADLQGVSRNLLEWQIEPPNLRLGQGLTESLEELCPPERRARGILSPLRFRTWSLAAAGFSTLLLVVAVASFFAPRHRVMRTDLYLSRQPNSARLADHFQANNGFISPSEPSGVIGGIINGSGQPAPPPLPRSANSQLENGPLIARTAELHMTTKEFGRLRTEIDRVLSAHQGYIAQLSTSSPSDQGHSLSATLRVPSGQLDAVLSELRKLGRVEAESQRGEEVTQQYIDLQARLQNARNTEQRLTELLRERTGKLSDVLAVEEQIDATRGQIETMEAEQKNLSKRIAFATLQLRIAEEYKESLNLERPSTSTNLRNAAIDGYRSVVNGAIGILLFLLTYGPGLLIAIAVLFFPVRAMLRRAGRVRSI